MYTEAETYSDRAISLVPDIASNYIFKAWTNMLKTNSTENARQILDDASKRADPEELTWTLTYFDIYDGHYQNALDRLASIQDEVFEYQVIYTPKDAVRGFIYELMGQKDQARTHYNKAQTLLE